MKKVIHKCMVFICVLCIFCSTCSVESPLILHAASQKMVNINYNHIAMVGAQKGNSSCACYAWAYLRTIIDGYVHHWSEFDKTYGSKGENDTWCMWQGSDSYFKPSDKSVAFKYMYNEIEKGKPTCVYVNTVGRGDEHWVTIVGYTGVTNINSLNESNFFMIDPADNSTLTSPKILASKYSLKFDEGVYNLRRIKEGFQSVKPTSGISITGQTYPTGTLNHGETFILRGNISSGLSMTKVYGGVYNRNGTATSQYYEVFPNTVSYNLYPAFDNKILFDKLAEGLYTYKIFATDTSGKTYTLVSSDFQIGNPKPVPSKPKSVKINAGTTVTPTVFTWDKCTNTDWYDIRIYFPGSTEPLIYWECKDTTLSVNLPKGSFRMNVAPVNKQYGTYTFSDDMYFDVGLGKVEPYATTEYNGHIYSLYNNLTNYTSAEDLCELMGGHLATITSAEENKAIASLINDDEREYWLGGTDVKVEGKWVWETSEPFKYTNWHKDDKYIEPNNYDKVEHYMTILKDGTWNDARHNAHFYDNGFGFILEIEPRTATVIKEYNNHIYYRFDSIGSGLNFHGLNWREAKAYCEYLGGDLVVISDQKENDFIKSFISDGRNDLYFIGLYDSTGKKDFKWVKNNDYTYRNWAEGKPDYSSNYKFYGGINKSGKWTNAENYSVFSSGRGFICEIEKQITSIEIKTLPKKCTYYLGESLDTTGLELTVKHKEGSDKVITSGFTTSVDMKSVGEKAVSVTYSGKTTTFKVQVVCPKPTVEIKSKSDTTIDISWNDIPNISEYAILLNEKEVARTKESKYTLKDLKADSEYKIQVVVYSGEKVLEKSAVITTETFMTVTFKGEGTEESPYLISTKEDLFCLSSVINDPENAHLYYKKYYKQTNDIDLGNENFQPMGEWKESQKYCVFNGVYDGNYCCITGLYVEKTEGRAGLFSILCGTVKNLSVYGKVISKDQAGGIAGNIHGGKIINCSFDGEVISSSKTFIGGIVGQIWRTGVVEGCYFNGVLNSDNAGGIVGVAYAGYEDFVQHITIDSCYATGTINGDTNKAGGIINHAALNNKESTITYKNNYYLADMAPKSIFREGCIKLTESDLKSYGNVLSKSFVNNDSDEFNDGYPIFKWQIVPYKFVGEGTKENPYQIRNKTELEAMRDLTNNEFFWKEYGAACYIQTADIDLENQKWAPIGKYSEDKKICAFLGTYDGNNHEIKNLYVNETEKFAGLFGTLRSNSSIRNLVVYGEVYSSGNSTGGICGEIGTGGCSISNCAFIGNVNGKANAFGGIVGYAWQNCYVENCYHIGDVTTSGSAGGIVGNITVTSENSRVLIQNCYHVGTVTGAKDKTAAIVGYSDIADTKTPAFINNCYYLKTESDKGINGEYTECDINAVSENIIKHISEDLGVPFSYNKNTELLNGYPVFYWQIPSECIGDLNGDRVADVLDAIIMKKYLLNFESEEFSDNSLADINQDGKVNVMDFRRMKCNLLNID